MERGAAQREGKRGVAGGSVQFSSVIITPFTYSLLPVSNFIGFFYVCGRLKGPPFLEVAEVAEVEEEMEVVKVVFHFVCCDLSAVLHWKTAVK